MKFNKIDKENLECTLQITIEPKDYLPDFKKQIKDIKSKGSFKGFRKGKTPDSFIHKMYGKSVLSEVVSKSIDKAFTDIVAEEKINYIAQPLPSTDQDLDIDYKDLKKNYEYSLDLGLIDDIQIKGLDKDDVYYKYEVSVDEKELEDHLENISKTFGTMESVDDDVQTDDVLKVSAVELDGDKEKKDGWMASFDIVMKSVTNDELKDSLLKLKKGDSFNANINDVTNRPASSIRKDLLGVEEGDDREIGEEFAYKIEDVERLKPAELTDELIKEKLSTWNLSSIEELKEDFKKNRKVNFEKDAKAMLYRDIMDTIMDKTEVTFSTSYLKRWLQESENVGEEKLDEVTESFSNEMKWVKIKEQLKNQYNVEITQGDINNKLYERARSILMQYGMQDESMLGMVIERLKKDQNEYYNIVSSAETEKIFGQIEGDLTVEMKEEGSEKFYEIVNERFNPAPAAGEEEE